MTVTLEDNKVTTRVLDSTEYNEEVTTKGSKTIDGFSSRIIHTPMKTVFTGARLNVITHTINAEEGSLPQSLMIQNTYTKMCNWGKNVIIIVRSSMAYLQTLKKKILVARVVAANWVLEPQMQPGMINALDEAQGTQTQKLTAEQRQEKLFKKLDLSSLESWSPELADSAQSLLAECHYIFSLEPCKLGCTHSTKCVIKVTNDSPFKE